MLLNPSGCSSMVEHQLPKLRVASSILVTRSSNIKASGDLHNPPEAFLVPIWCPRGRRIVMIITYTSSGPVGPSFWDRAARCREFFVAVPGVMNSRQRARRPLWVRVYPSHFASYSFGGFILSIAAGLL